MPHHHLNESERRRPERTGTKTARRPHRHRLAGLGVAILVAAQLALGALSASAADDDQELVFWGRVTSGQEDGVPPAARSGVTALSAGDAYTLALKSDGTVVAWGYDGDRLTKVPAAAASGVVAIAAGTSHAAVAKQDGSVVTWSSYHVHDTPVPDTAVDVVDVAAGSFHFLALRRDGSVVGWGLDQYGDATPPDAAMSGVVDIAAAGNHSLALKDDGSVVAWGEDSNGLSQVPDAAKSGVVAISAGQYFSLALKDDGSVVAWGDGRSGETAVPVAAQSGVVAISAGNSASMALKDDGSVVAWGNNFAGQVDVPATLSSGVTAIAAGFYHMVALHTEPKAAPGSPVIAGVTVGDAQAEVAFTPGATGSPRTVFYTATATPTAGGAAVTATGAGSPLTVTGLTNGISYRFTVTASNTTGEAVSETSTATVGVAPAISGTPPTATVGTAYSYPFMIDGQPAPTTTVTAGKLPAGLSLGSDGKLTGTPTTAGSSSFTVAATNALGRSAANVTLTVAPRTTPAADLGLSITSATTSSAAITYTMTVTNKGPAAATKVSTAVLLPRGTYLQSATGPTPRVRVGSRIVRWQAESVRPGATVTYTVTVVPTRSGPKTLAGMTGSLQIPDPNLANNTAVRTHP